MKKIYIAVECAAVVALCTVLSFIKIFKMPFGGSITLFSMAPLMLIAFKRGAKIGIYIGIMYGILRLMISFDAPPAGNFISLVLVCVMDYLLSYSVLGLAPIFSFGIKKRPAAIFTGTFIAGFTKYIISVFSGVLIWGSYVTHTQSVWMYSIIYNTSYMLPEIIITSFACVLINKYLKFI